MKNLYFRNLINILIGLFVSKYLTAQLFLKSLECDGLLCEKPCCYYNPVYYMSKLNRIFKEPPEIDESKIYSLRASEGLYNG
jgi:hypothetical protein